VVGWCILIILTGVDDDREVRCAIDEEWNGIKELAVDVGTLKQGWKRSNSEVKA
jgi:hypothetical protein